MTNSIRHKLTITLAIFCLSFNLDVFEIHLPASKDPLVLRTYFQSDSVWTQICSDIKQPNKEYGFVAYVEFLSDTGFANYDQTRILADTTSLYTRSFIFIADSITFIHPEHPVLCLGLFHDREKQFRVIPSEMWGVENNLSISNMDFEDFSQAVDRDGIFRGFK